MKFRAFKVVLGLGLSALALTACSADADTASPTPVAFKACLIGTPAGFNDGAMNQLAYAGLQQSAVQFGTSISVLSARDYSVAGVTSAAKKLVSRGCNFVLALGANAYDGLTPLANGNPDVRFESLTVGVPPVAETTPANLVRQTLSVKQAYMQAGYLAAVAAKGAAVGVIPSNDASVVAAASYFRLGVLRYQTDTGNYVTLLGAAQVDSSKWSYLSADTSPSHLKARAQALVDAGATVLVPLGVNQLPVAQVALASGAAVITSDADWGTLERFSKVRAAVAASVVAPFAEAVNAGVGNAMIGVLGTVAGVNSDTKEIAFEGTLLVTRSGKVDWPSGIDAGLQKIADELAANNP